MYIAAWSTLETALPPVVNEFASNTQLPLRVSVSRADAAPVLSQHVKATTTSPEFTVPDTTDAVVFDPALFTTAERVAADRPEKVKTSKILGVTAPERVTVTVVEPDTKGVVTSAMPMAPAIPAPEKAPLARCTIVV